MAYTAFIFGLLGSLHCLGMCGPIAFMLPVDRSNAWKRNTQIGTYHIGRLFSYALLGLLFGLLGEGLQLFGLQQALSIAVGILMILVAIVPESKLKGFRLTAPIYRSLSWVKQQLGGLLKKKSWDAFLTIGFLNGLLPCGLVYLAVFGALASGSPAGGAFYMFLFGLGTVPLMTSAVYLGNFLKPEIRKRIRSWIPIVVGLMGILFVLRGLGLGIPFISPMEPTPTVQSDMDCAPGEVPFNNTP